MTPIEAKNGTNKNRVRMFSKDHLCKPVVDEKWDRVKVVCRQPFNRYQQYGLCFITFHSSEGHTLGRFELKDEDDTGSYKAGFLFARRKDQSQNEEPLKGAAAIRAASRPEALSQKAEPKKNKVLEELEQKRNTHSPQAHSSVDKPKKPKTVDTPKRKSPSPQRPSSLEDKPKKPKTVNTPSPQVKMKNKPFTIKIVKKGTTGDDHNMKNGVKRPSSSDRNSGKKVKVVKPFNKLLEGVVFVISGYQNPERSNVRSMALEMGAKYKPDWDNSCTHLVCAFMNTPKYQQVNGKGRIVRKEWIEQCHARRARLPWRRHALDKKEQNKPESEDEILEEVPQSPVHLPVETGSEPEMGSGSDTEEEIERVRANACNSTPDSNTDVKEPEKPPDKSSLPDSDTDMEEPEKPRNKSSLPDSDTDVDEPEKPRNTSSLPDSDTDVDEPEKPRNTSSLPDSDTDVDEPEKPPDTSSLPLPPLPNALINMSFFVRPEDHSHQKLICRYIIANGGSILTMDAEKVDYIVSDESPEIVKEEFEQWPKATVVDYSWVLDKLNLKLKD
ncbi:DNA repair protein XRCC1 isoform X2 [Anabrus simplex]